MTVEGDGQIIRNPGSSGAMRIDRLYWSESGSSDSDDFTAIPVAAGVTLVIWAWWLMREDTNLVANVAIDHEIVTPDVSFINPTLDLAADPVGFFTSVAGLSAGDHTVGVIFDGGDPGVQGGLVVMHVPDGSFFAQDRLGG